MPFRNPFDSPGHWYKANLHAHTSVSDGDVSVPERVRQFRDKGYDILAITDHRVTSDVSQLSSDDFLVISGMEAHPECPGSEVYHLVLLDVPHGFSFSSGPDPNALIRAAREAGGEVIIAHPYWCGHNINNLLPLEGPIAVEVYNGTCTGVGKGFSSVHWDDLLQAGRILPAVAVDDVHHPYDIFMGWTMIRAESLTVKSVMDALRSGCFYATTGPVIEDARIVDGKAMVKCSPAVEIHFVAQGATGRAFYAHGSEPLTEMEWTVNPRCRYVRIEVVDANGGHAWTNPFVL